MPKPKGTVHNLQRKVEQQQLEILEGLVGRTLPSFKHLTVLLWGKPYYNNTCRVADMKRLAEFVDIEYRDDTWQVKIVKMK